MTKPILMKMLHTSDTTNVLNPLHDDGGNVQGEC